MEASSNRLIARRGAAVRGVAAVPGDKSCSHRALILGAMAEGTTRIRGLLDSADTGATIEAVRALGAEVSELGGEWHVTGAAWRSPDAPIDCGNSGTTARLLLGAAAGIEGLVVSLTGDGSLSRRPMDRVTAPLRRMGAGFDGDSERLPLTLRGARLGGIEHRNVPPSAQVKSALLFAGLRTGAPVRVVEPVPSRDHSEIMLAAFGCDVVTEDLPDGWSVSLGERRTPVGCALTVGGDPSSAAFPLVAAAILAGSDVTVTGVIVNPLRTGLYEVLERMGAELSLSNEHIQSGEIVADIRVKSAPLQPCHVEASAIPAMIDEIPALAVACAFADGESVIEGLAELRVKESDRLGAIVAGLVACGVAATVHGDSLHIFGSGAVRGGARIATHGDHRIAMAFLTLGLASDEPVEVDGAGMIATSFPGFVEVMRSIGADIG